MFLSKTEQAYLSGTRDFTKAQARCIRYRINKKLKLLDRDAAAAFRDAAGSGVGGIVVVVCCSPPPSSGALLLHGIKDDDVAM